MCSGKCCHRVHVFWLNLLVVHDLEIVEHEYNQAKAQGLEAALSTSLATRKAF